MVASYTVVLQLYPTLLSVCCIICPPVLSKVHLPQNKILICGDLGHLGDTKDDMVCVNARVNVHSTVHNS
jgi:hypothetical protein